MPSVTVVVSSCTDIYISPGLYGDCLPTGATGAAADSFRAGSMSFRFSLMLAHPAEPAQRPVDGPRPSEGRRPPAGGSMSRSGIHVTWTLSPSSI
ncbi:hypothetical protein CP978_10420 [Streptomyces nodosus]|uniref:Uncharacterized protein n=1 Tax=Streptomyces nodosus TaxID=40318 RepID=A0A5P2VZ80_9ACTN|nr:hypothetical protein CP978_10420 [Streptomyces nodosus]